MVAVGASGGGGVAREGAGDVAQVDQAAEGLGRDVAVGAQVVEGAGAGGHADERVAERLGGSGRAAGAVLVAGRRGGLPCLASDRLLDGEDLTGPAVDARLHQVRLREERACLVGADGAVTGEHRRVVAQAQSHRDGHPHVDAPHAGAGQGVQVHGLLDRALQHGLHPDPIAAEGVQERGDVLLPGRQVRVLEGHRLRPAAYAGEGGGHLGGGAVHDELRHPVHPRPAAHPGALARSLVALARGFGVDADGLALHRRAQLAGRRSGVGVEAEDLVQHERGVRRREVLDLRQHRQCVRHSELPVLQRVDQPRLAEQAEGRRHPAHRGVRRDVQHAGDLAGDELPLLRLSGLDHPHDRAALLHEPGRLRPRTGPQRAGQRRCRGEQQVLHNDEPRRDLRQF